MVKEQIIHLSPGNKGEIAKSSANIAPTAHMSAVILNVKLYCKVMKQKKIFEKVPTAGVYEEDCSKTSGARYLFQIREPVKS